MANLLRNEKKVPLDSLEALLDLRFWLKSRGYSFRRTFANRNVNSLYFDSIDLDDLSSNFSGISERKKVRLRWYGDNLDHIDDGTLEVKIKRNQFGFKKNTPVENLHIGGLNSVQIYQNLAKIVAGEIKVFLSDRTRPTLFCRYHREYYANPQGVRVTLDTQIRYQNLTSPRFDLHHTTKGSPFALAEIKYPSNSPLDELREFESLPAKIFKNSKYVNGMVVFI